MNIGRLIAKDLRLQQSFFLMLLLIEIGGVAMFKLQLNSTAGILFSLTNGVALIGDFLLCYRTMLAEEKNRALLLVRILPVSTREIVISKFAVNFLLSTLNLAICFGLLGILQSLDVVSNQISWSLGLLPFFAFHWLVNGFFVSMSLVADSERVVWIPFPALFLVMSFLLNYQKIMGSLGLAAFSEALSKNDLALSGAPLILECAAMAATLKIVQRKRMFG